MRLSILILLISFQCNADSIEQLIFKHALKNGIDPQLALAIAKTESELNPKAKGKLGEIGIYQLRPQYHKGNLWNVEKNIAIGIKYLAYVKGRCYSRYGDAWFICTNTGPNRSSVIRHPKKFDYYVKVKRHLSLIASNE